MSAKIYMLNAIWYKPNGGEAKYRKYMKTVNPMIESVGGKRLRSLVPSRALIGEFDADLLYFVEFPDWDAYKKFANGSEYHRLAPVQGAVSSLRPA